MSNVVPLFDADLAQRQADRSIAQARRNADKAWRDAALFVVHDLALRGGVFTTDDCWFALGDVESTHERRAMGAVMRDAAARGWVKATSEYRPTARVAAHARPVRVWCSLLDSDGPVG